MTVVIWDCLGAHISRQYGHSPIAYNPDLSVTDESGNTLLTYTARATKSPELIDLLISKGLDLQALNINEANAALAAAERNPNLNVVEYVVGLGVDPLRWTIAAGTACSMPRSGTPTSTY